MQYRISFSESDTRYNHVVYGIRLRSEDFYRYIGYTTKGVATRARMHERDSKKYHTPLYSWYRKYRTAESFVIEVLEHVPDNLDLLKFREQFWIATYRESFVCGIYPKPLLNIRDGGDGKIDHSIGQKERWSRDRTGTGNPMHGLKGPSHPAYGYKVSAEERANRTLRYTGERNPMAVLTREKVEVIRRRHSSGESQAGLAREFGVSKAAIRKIVLHLTWK